MAGAARSPQKQSDRQAHQQKTQTVVDGGMVHAKAFSKEREQQASDKAKMAGGLDAAGSGISLVTA
jgi:hypothetical protein